MGLLSLITQHHFPKAAGAQQMLRNLPSEGCGIDPAMIPMLEYKSSNGLRTALRIGNHHTSDSVILTAIYL